MAAAEREIASRRLGPLTHLLDTGQPVVIGSLTVDQLGVSARGRWHVSWQQARQVNIRLHGQRVLVKVGRLGTKRAALDGLPNSFLARYVIEHAARQAGVPVVIFTGVVGWHLEFPAVATGQRCRLASIRSASAIRAVPSPPEVAAAANDRCSAAASR
jgi:hypothetical protein